MELHLKIVGVLLVALSLLHIGFPRYFRWKEELASLSLMNRQMMYVHSFFIATVVCMNGLLCLVLTNDLITTPLGNKLSLALGLFWTMRLFIQLFGYSSDLWRGRLFETSVHIFFSLMWIYFSAVFLLVYFRNSAFFLYNY